MAQRDPSGELPGVLLTVGVFLMVFWSWVPLPERWSINLSRYVQQSPYRRLGMIAAVLGVLVPIAAMIGVAWGPAIVRAGWPLWIPMGIGVAMLIGLLIRSFPTAATHRQTPRALV
ncbi:MAG: hypothetical protein AB7L28_05310 [Kofleriaceae bacterium]